MAARLQADHLPAPSSIVLTRLLETLYFASLKRIEGRPVVCTMNFADPDRIDPIIGRDSADRRHHHRFKTPLPFDVGTLTSLAKAADPAAASISVFTDKGNRLVIWGMVDQETRHGERFSSDAGARLIRPGLFTATILGVGKLSVSVDGALVGSLAHDALVEQYYDALGAGPVHQILRSHLASYLRNALETRPHFGLAAKGVEGELLVRWLNAIRRTLLAMQDYKTGGGLLFAPSDSRQGLNIKYELEYDRLPKSLLGLVERDLLALRLEAQIAEQTPNPSGDTVPRELHDELIEIRSQRDEFRNAALGACRFIASLSCVDGFVLLDRSMVVQGFGVEVRTDTELSDIFVASDSEGSHARLRPAELEQFGTRHRAMMRYCYENAGGVGFVVSQDGEIRVMTRLGDKLVIWENLDLELCLKGEPETAGRHAPLSYVPQIPPVRAVGA
ncbi:MAG: hypothetical protein U1D30_15405 [Planctomycetota bacterium]